MECNLCGTELRKITSTHLKGPKCKDDPERGRRLSMTEYYEKWPESKTNGEPWSNGGTRTVSDLAAEHEAAEEMERALVTFQLELEEIAALELASAISSSAPVVAPAGSPPPSNSWRTRSAPDRVDCTP